MRKPERLTLNIDSHSPMAGSDGNEDRRLSWVGNRWTSTIFDWTTVGKDRMVPDLLLLLTRMWRYCLWLISPAPPAAGLAWLAASTANIDVRIKTRALFWASAGLDQSLLSASLLWFSADNWFLCPTLNTPRSWWGPTDAGSLLAESQNLSMHLLCFDR